MVGMANNKIKQNFLQGSAETIEILKGLRESHHEQSSQGSGMRYDANKIYSLSRTGSLLRPEKPTLDYGSIRKKIYLDAFFGPSFIMLLVGITFGLAGSAFNLAIPMFMGVLSGLCWLGVSVTKLAKSDFSIEKLKSEHLKKMDNYLLALADLTAAKMIGRIKIVSPAGNWVRRQPTMLALSRIVELFFDFTKQLRNSTIAGKEDVEEKATSFYLAILTMLENWSDTNSESVRDKLFEEIELAIQKFSLFSIKNSEEIINNETNTLNQTIEELESSLEVARSVEEKMKELKSSFNKEKENA